MDETGAEGLGKAPVRLRRGGLVLIPVDHTDLLLPGAVQLKEVVGIQIRQEGRGQLQGADVALVQHEEALPRQLLRLLRRGGMEKQGHLHRRAAQEGPRPPVGAGGQVDQIQVGPEAGGEIDHPGPGGQLQGPGLCPGQVVQAVADAQSVPVHRAVPVSGEVQCQGADAVPGELPGQQLGGGAVLAAAEAVGDEADHGLAALDGVPAGDVISVESGEKFLCHKRSFQRARAPFSAALPKADLKIPQQNDQAGNRRSNW